MDCFDERTESQQLHNVRASGHVRLRVTVLRTTSEFGIEKADITVKVNMAIINLVFKLERARALCP